MRSSTSHQGVELRLRDEVRRIRDLVLAAQCSLPDAERVSTDSVAATLVMVAVRLDAALGLEREP